MVENARVIVQVKPLLLFLRHPLLDQTLHPTAPVHKVELVMGLKRFPSLSSHSFRFLRRSQSGHNIIRVEDSQRILLLQLSRIETQSRQVLTNVIWWVSEHVVFCSDSLAQRFRCNSQRGLIPRRVRIMLYNIMPAVAQPSRYHGLQNWKSQRGQQAKQLTVRGFELR